MEETRNLSQGARVQLFKENESVESLPPDGQCSDHAEASQVQGRYAAQHEITNINKMEPRAELTDRRDGAESPEDEKIPQHSSSYHGVRAPHPHQVAHLSSPDLSVGGQDQSSPLISGKQFSRDAFLQTGRFDNDINMLLREAELESDFDPRSSTDADYTDHSQLVREIPEGLSELDLDQTGLDTTGFSNSQSVLSVTAVSNSREHSSGFEGDQSLSDENQLEQVLSKQLSPTSSSQAHAELKTKASSSSGVVAHLSNMKLQSSVDAFIHGSDQLHSLDDSLSSGVTEPEETVVGELPLALLMYSQPKVWTDDEGNISRDLMSPSSIGNNSSQEAEGLEDSMTSADLWMQDNMLKTVVPQEKLRSETSNHHDDSVGSRSSDHTENIESHPDIDNREDKENIEDQQEADGLAHSSGPVDIRELSTVEGSDLSVQSQFDNESSDQLEGHNNLSLKEKPSSQSEALTHQSREYRHDDGQSSQSLTGNTQISPSGQAESEEKKSILEDQPSHLNSRQLLHQSGMNSQKLDPTREDSESCTDFHIVSVSDGRVVQKSQSKRQAASKVPQKPWAHSKHPTGKSSKNSSSQSMLKVPHQTTAQPGNPCSSVASKVQKRAPLKSTESTKRDVFKVPKASGSTLQKKTKSFEDNIKDGNMKDDSSSESLHASTAQTSNNAQSTGATVGSDYSVTGKNEKKVGWISGNLFKDSDPHYQEQPVYSRCGPQDQGKRQMHSSHEEKQKQLIHQGHLGSQGLTVHQRHPQGHQILQGQMVPQDHQVPQDHILQHSPQKAQGHRGLQGHQGLYGPSAQGQGVTRYNQASIEELLGDVGSDVFNMEQVRGHLHSMLQVTASAIPDKKVYDQTDHQLSLSSYLDDKDDTSSFMSGTFQSTASGKSLSELTAQMESLSSLPPGAMNPKVGTGGLGYARRTETVMMENQLLRESLEKEAYRRKHCEKQIQLLQNKNLELQQQLAVAINTDSKKDQMIEQLDRALGKVVDGWKQREAEKVGLIQQLQVENGQLVSQTESQQQLLKKFRIENSNMVDQLTSAQHGLEQAERNLATQVADLDRQRLTVLHDLELERERLHSATSELEQLAQQADKLRGQLHNTKSALENERESWEEKEREYLQKIDEITENHLLAIEQERVKNEKQSQALHETQEVLSAVQNQLQQLRIDLDTTTREKESLHVQIGILEAKMESSLRKQEADLRSEAERKMLQSLDEAHHRQRATEVELQEHHRRQVYELSERHAIELKEQHQQHQVDLRRKEEFITRKVLDFEEKISEAKKELQTIQEYVKKLEEERVSMASKLQTMMQDHCNEALGILNMGVPQSSSAQTSQTFTALLNTMYTMSPTRQRDTTMSTYSADHQRSSVKVTSNQLQPSEINSSEKHHMQNAPTLLQHDFSIFTRETDDLNGGHHGNQQNSSYSTEESGCLPLPLDTTTETVNEPGTDELTMSMGRISDMSEFPRMNNPSSGPLLPSAHGSYGSPAQHRELSKVDYVNMSEKFQQHDDRQHELQKYMRMLLQRSPGSLLDDPDVTFGAPSRQHGMNLSSQGQTMVTPPDNQPPPFEVRGQGQPQRAAFSMTTVTSPDRSYPDFSAANIQAGLTKAEGGLSPTQVSEISRLLAMHRSEQSTGPVSGATQHNPPVEDVFTYLRDLNTSKPATQAVHPQSQAYSSSDNSQQMSEQPTREAPVSRRVVATKTKEHKVILVPTGMEPTNSSPPRHGRTKPVPSKGSNKPANTSTKHGSTEQERKSTAQHDKKADVKNKQKGGSKVWK